MLRVGDELHRDVVSLADVTAEVERCAESDESMCGDFLDHQFIVSVVARVASLAAEVEVDERKQNDLEEK